MSELNFLRYPIPSVFKSNQEGEKKDSKGNNCGIGKGGFQENNKCGKESGGTQEPEEDFGTRPDGSKKGLGYFGKLQRPDGDFSTEISIGVDWGEGEQEIPLLVPTLDDDEVQSLLNDEEPSDAIVDKAIEHAQKRIAAGKSPFAGKGEQKPRKKKR